MADSSKIKKILLVMMIITVLIVMSIVIALTIVNKKIKKEEDVIVTTYEQAIGKYYLLENGKRVNNVYFDVKSDGVVVRSTNDGTSDGKYTATKKSDDVIEIVITVGDYKATGTIKDGVLDVDGEKYYKEDAIPFTSEKYVRYVFDKPTDDYLIIRSDGTCEYFTNGKLHKGTYNTNESGDTIAFTFDGSTGMTVGKLVDGRLIIDDMTFYTDDSKPSFELEKVKSVYYAYDDDGNKLENEFIKIMDGENGSVVYNYQSGSSSLGSVNIITQSNNALVIGFKPNDTAEKTFEGTVQKDNYGVLSIGDKKYYREGKYCGNIKGEYHEYDENSLKQSNYLKIDTDGRYEYFKNNAKYYGVCEISINGDNTDVTFVGDGGLTNGSVSDGVLTLKGGNKLYLDGKCPDPEYAFAFEIYDDKKLGNGAKITSLIDTSAETIVIPEFVVKNNTPYTVIAVGDEAFKDAAIKSVELPKRDIIMGNRAFSGSSITSIVLYNSFDHADDGIGAFENCTRLLHVTLSDTARTIPDNTFSGCDALQTVNIPNSVENIGKSAFEGCSSIYDMTFSENLKSIGESAFVGCSKLEKIDLSQTRVNTIGESAFGECSKLVDVKLNDGVKKLNYGMFKDCVSLESLTVPFVGQTVDDNKHIGYLFGTEDASKSSTVVPATLHTVTITRATDIAEKAFYNCKNINTVVLPNTLRTIGERAFYDVGLTTAPTFYEGLERIGTNAFRSINGNEITSLELPKSLTHIGLESFYGWNSLTEITLPFVGIEDGHSTYFCFGHIFYDSTYSSHVPETLVSVNITNAKIINKYAFMNCKYIKSITLPDTLQSIGGFAFEGCPLVSMIIPSSVTLIGTSIFSNNTTLESLTVPFIGSKLGDNKKLNYYFASNEVTYNPDVPSTLKSVTVTNQSVFADYTFNDCNKITSITLLNKESVNLGKYMFQFCNSLTDVNIPRSVTSIPANAFFQCVVLTTINYGGTVDEWNDLTKGNNWKANSDNLKTVKCTNGNVDL